jgi:adenine/guanine phosphoribosyltransferase-like PRPP-binding protein
VTVPHLRLASRGKPLAAVAEAIAAADNRFVAQVDTLIRTKTISKLAKGGERSVANHLDSIEVRKPASLKGKMVVVLDDTVTSEGSITAARALLQNANAKVVAIGLARTVKYL